MRRLHVVIVAPGFAAEREEPGLAALVDLVERLAIVHDVEVIALRHPKTKLPYQIAGATVRPLGLGPAVGPVGRARVAAGGASAVLRCHRRQAIDVIHGLWADEAGAIATAAARLISRPALVSVLGGELVGLADIGYGAALGRGGRWTVAASLRLADLLTVGSTYVRELVLARRPRARVELVPLGIDVDLFRPADGVPPVPTVLFVGSLEAVKDPALMLRTFAGVGPGRPGLRLTIAGAGSMRAQLEHLASALGIADRVDFRGQLARSAMPGVYRSASVLCVTSRHEAQSMAAIEAAASCLPIVGLHVGALPDLGAGALTVAVGDEPALVRQLARVLDDPGLAARMSAAARAAAVADYDIERTAGRILDCYAGLVSPRQR